MKIDLKSILVKVAEPTIKKLEALIVPVLAKEAVDYAEANLVGSAGADKKKVAINYIIGKLPIPIYLAPLKPIIVAQLSNIIDQGIESAVTALKAKEAPASDTPSA